MQTVPSLVGSGTAAAAAALGLVFAHPEHDSTSTRTSTHRKRANTALDDFRQHPRLSSAPVSSRPVSSAAGTNPFADGSRPPSAHYHNYGQPSPTTNAPRQRPASAQVTPPRTVSRRQSVIRQGDQVTQPVNENPRDSVSSNSSWIRRFSLRPLSQHGSLRSSGGPDNHSIAFSHGSSAPILSDGTAPTPLPPNKLVKRAPSAHQNGAATRRRAKSHLPTLRRPATSHQRSATLQQNLLDLDELTDEPVRPKYSFDLLGSEDIISSLPSPRPLAYQPPAPPPREPGRWTSLFHTRRVSVSVRGTPDRLLDRGAVLQKRIRPTEDHKKDICLVNGDMITRAGTASHRGDSTTLSESSPAHSQNLSIAEEPERAPDETPTKRTKRSLSTHFSSPTSLFSKTGSLRRTKRVTGAQGETKRHVSAPLPTAQEAPPNDLTSPASDAVAAYSTQIQQQQQPGTALAPIPQGLSRHRNSSSPLPPLSRLSSFNVDLTKLGATSAGHPPRSNQPSGSSQSSNAMASFRNARHERSSTLNSSDLEVRGFHSGDDDDTDFKSDTMFDSIRTAASGRNRAPESPAESMFDESPPSTAGNGKTKRLSIQEILGHAWDIDSKIMEEDETTHTPTRRPQDPQILVADQDDASVAHAGQDRPSADYAASQRDLARMSLEDDLDDDWARDYDEDDMAWGNRLSPPSSMNSRGVSPNLRFALASANGNDLVDITRDLRGERPRSNIFDWTEPSNDKADPDGSSLRPKTVHGKQEMDLRGGRTSNRKGPAVAHVRSQSVPVVYDPSDNAKPAGPKYGTWGLGTKGASEDWDDDFEFDSNDAETGVDHERHFDMVVPASIQASQPSLKQHSGQIRELSLLVNDLKRLCRHGRDLDMLEGPHASLWKEAEGIIALASPDEDELEGMDVDSSDIDFEPSIGSDKVSDSAFESGPLKNIEDAFEPQDLGLAKTTVIRERPAGRRRSVFSPDDDIFGGNKTTADSSAAPSRPKTPENNINMGGHDVTDIVKSVLDAMQQRSTSEASSRGSKASDSKLHFGTNNLKALVKRAGDLRDALSEDIRRIDQITQSPARTPRRGEKDSPAFTRVFTPEPPSSSPPKKLPHSRSNNSVLSRGSHEQSSPSGGMSRRMQMMTVS